MSAMAGLGPLLRLGLRRERWRAATWIGLIALMAVGTVGQYRRTFPTAAARESFAAFVTSNPLLAAFGGQLPGHTLAGLAYFKIADIAFTLAAVMALLMAVRLTRGDEEAGRLELVAAGPVGRLASLAAGLLVPWGASVALGALVAAAWIGLGLPAAGALAFGGAIAAAGCVFAGIGAVAAQACIAARTAELAALAALAGAYMIRFAADGLGWPALRWASPLGWSHLVQAFGANRTAVLLVPLAATAALAALAAGLQARRDLGAGLVPERPGPAAGPGLTGVLALAWRLQRGRLAGWALGFGLVGLLAGAVVEPRIGAVITGSPWGQELARRFGAGAGVPFEDVFLWVLLLSLGYVATLYPLLAAIGLRADEASGRAELLLATPTSRTAWLASHVAVAALGTAILMAVAGLGVGAAYGLRTGALASEVPRILAGALIQIPAVWTVGAVGVLGFGALPRATGAIAWGAFLAVNLSGEVIGPALGIPYDVANRIVPFHYLPRVVAGGAFEAAPLLALLAAALMTTAAGTWAFRRRDVG